MVERAMTPGDSLRRAAAEAPRAEAYVHRGRRLTFGRWNELSERFAANLVRRGLVRGDRVAVVLPPRPEYAVAFVGAAKAGLVTAGVNPRLADPEIVHVLRDSGARLAVAIDDFAGRSIAGGIRARASQLPELRELVVVESERTNLGEDVGAQSSFAALLGEPRATDLASVGRIGASLGADDAVAIVYTSGTTGTPKGALFANRNLAAVARTRAEMGTRPGDRGLTSGTPFAHVGYMTKITANIEDRHTTIILDGFKAREALAAVERERVTQLGGVPAQWSLMLLEPEFDRFDLSSLRIGAIGGAPFAPDLVREIRRRFRIELVTRYACTEIALGTSSRPDDPEDLLAETVGRPGGGVELRIVDDRRRPLGAGETGEVAVRGPAVMVGYWNRPEETHAVLDAEGWFYTGDLGALDEKGYLRLRGRKKEMYIRGGYNVYPAEVEAALARHPAIAQAAVVGIDDPVLGEKGLAVIVAREGAPAPTPAEVRAFCRAELADYKIPDFVELRSELPLNATYKVDKKRLREEFVSRSR